MSAQYSEVHQAFLQMIVHRGAVEIVEAQQIFACIWKTYGTGEIETKFLEQTVQKINTRIANLDAKIVLYQYGLNQKIFWVYVNTAASSIDK